MCILTVCRRWTYLRHRRDSEVNVHFGKMGARRRLVRRLVVGAGIAALVLTGAQAPAAPITVNTTADEVNGDGDCSLREAILAANTNAVIDACAAGESAATDEITLTPGATYTLTLAAPALVADDPLGGDLDLANNTAAPDVVIRAGAADPATIHQTVSGQKVFSVNGTAEFDGVVITGGDATDCGGGIAFLGSGVSSVGNSTLAGNSAGSGGAICNQASGSQLHVENTRFLDNLADAPSGQGGALYNVSGSASITGSVFLRNSAVGSGGGRRQQPQRRRRSLDHLELSAGQQ